MPSICTISSVIGGIAGYFIGFFFYNSIGIKIVQYYSLENLFSSFESSYNEYGIHDSFWCRIYSFSF